MHGTEVVLRAAAKKSKLVVIASTSEVYGKSADVPFREDGDLVLGPTSKHRWAYACSKAIDEFLALAYYKEKKLPVIVVRFFNTVGPRQTGRYGMVVPNFVRQALDGKPITVFGDGTQTRCFTYVGDVVDALVKLSPGAARDRRGVQHRQRGGGQHPRTGRAREGLDRQRLAHRDHPVRRGLRVRLRGHAAARARHRQGAGAHRLRAQGQARRDPRNWSSPIRRTAEAWPAMERIWRVHARPARRQWCWPPRWFASPSTGATRPTRTWPPASGSASPKT